MPNTFRVVIAEDEPRILQFLEKKIQFLDPRFEVVGTARNGMDALSLVEELHPHVLFSDVQMPVMSGLELLAKTRQSCPKVRSVIISGFRDFDYVREAMRYEVIDYLLKPIMDQELVRILHSLAEELEKSMRLEEQEALSAAMENRLNLEQSRLYQTEERYSILLISIGHLMSHTSQILHSRIFQNIWKKIDFAGLMEKSGIRLENWWICNGWDINHRYLIWKTQETSKISGRLPELLENLEPFVNGYPVNLCMLSEELSLHQLHHGVVKLQESVRRTLVPGKSRILPLKEQKHETSHEMILTTSQSQLLKSLITSRRTEETKKQLEKLLQGWIDCQYSQAVFENGLRQLLRLFAAAVSMEDEDEIYLAEYHILGALSACRSPEELFPEIWEVLSHFLNHQELCKDYALKTAEDVEQYIRSHYTEDISLDSIASIMGFHTVYLNRIFKKEKQITPIQFLINLRIEKAKELIRQNPTWDFATIGECVGYHDPHYFSRAFKKVVGQSPSEYRSMFE